MASPSVAALKERFGIPGVAEILTGNGGLAKVVVSAPEATGEMYLHGAQVTSWISSGRNEALYVSPNSIWQDGRAIRGGVPICFPWFGDKQGDPSAPAHGFVRTKSWELEGIESRGEGIEVTMSTTSDDVTRKWWPFDFRLICRGTFARGLQIDLIVTNSGSSAFWFEEALHAYFAVGDAESALVHGLDATRYIDKTDNRIEKMQSGDIYITAETDRVYLDTTGPVELVDLATSRRIHIWKQSSQTTVVWNPWMEKSIALKDLGPEQWKEFVCIETANVAPLALKLGPGETHTMVVKVQAMP